MANQKLKEQKKEVNSLSFKGCKQLIMRCETLRARKNIYSV